MFVALTVTDVRGYHVPLERQVFGRSFRMAIDRDVLELPDTVEDDLSKPADVILKPAFDMLWQADGWNLSCSSPTFTRLPQRVDGSAVDRLEAERRVVGW